MIPELVVATVVVAVVVVSVVVRASSSGALPVGVALLFCSFILLVAVVLLKCLMCMMCNSYSVLLYSDQSKQPTYHLIHVHNSHQS